MKHSKRFGWGGNRRSLPVLILLLSLATTVLVWVWTGQVVGSKDRQRFTFATEEAEEAIKGRISDEVDLLRASVATYKLQGSWTRDQFHKYVMTLAAGSSFHGAQGLGFILRVSPANVKKLEETMKSQGEADFAVHPIETSRDQYPVVLLEPLTPLSTPSLGYDAWDDPIRRSAMSQACDTGQPTLSALVTVPVPRGRSLKGFQLFCPIYDTDGTPASIKLRRTHLVGFVYRRFRGSDIFQGVLEGEARHDLNIEIFDAESGKTPIRFYTSSRERVKHPAKIVFDGYIPVQGRQWLVRYQSSAAFEQQSATWLVNTIPVVGVFIGLILFAISYGQVNAYRQLNQQAVILARSESHQRLIANVGAVLVDFGANDQAFRSVARLMVANFADWFAICQSSGERATFTSEVNERLEMDPATLLSDPPLLEWIVQHRVPMRFDLSHGPDVHLEPLQKVGLHGFCILPLSTAAGAQGMLLIGRTKQDFMDEDIKVLVQIASRVSVSIESERLRHEKEIELEERIKAEQEARRINENLEQLVEERTTELKATNRELEAFCYSVSHDLRAPLRSVDGFSKSLLEDYKEQLDDQARDYLNRVRNASHRMDELISALLNLSRITRLEIVRQPIDMTQMARTTMDEALEAHDPARYRIVIQPGMVAEADPKLMRVVFDNLFRNAIKFTQPIENPVIEVGLEGVTFFVRDNGVGFNPAYSDKLFQAFERLHSQHEFPGSGIGLATVERIIQRHGGTIAAQSSEGNGATFYFQVR